MAQGKTRRAAWSVLAAAAVVAGAVFAILQRGGTDLASRRAARSSLPALNASLNAASAVALAAGFLCIRVLKRKAAHAACMLAALGASVAFLASYLYYHARVGSVPYGGGGWARWAYFSVLISHSVLAPIVVPLVAVVLVHAARRRFERHRAWARWTLPLWLYVSITGVAIYLMLYG